MAGILRLRGINIVLGPIDVMLLVTRAFEQLSIPYVVGGSMASSIYGMARSTRDADLVADVRREHIQPFMAAIGSDFYVSESAIREAIDRHGSFNVVHQAAQFKVDIFVRASDPFTQSQFARRQREPMATEPTQEAFVASPEDTLLSKLAWYKQGGETSDQQWKDVLGILKIQGSRLDLAYARQWAAQLGVHELLARALQEAHVA